MDKSGNKLVARCGYMWFYVAKRWFYVGHLGCPNSLSIVFWPFQIDRSFWIS